LRGGGVDSVASVDFNYHALRAQQARFGRILSGVVARLLPWLSGLLWLLGIVLLIVERLSVGWLACALGCFACCDATEDTPDGPDACAYKSCDW